MERTVVLVKPDAVIRGFIGEVISRFERKGLKVVGCKMMQLKEAILREHYAHVADQPFFKDLSQFMSSSPVVALCIEGPAAVSLVRTVCGEKHTELGSIRGDLAPSRSMNIVHSSDSPETAKREIERFFSKDELFDYTKE